MNEELLKCSGFIYKNNNLMVKRYPFIFVEEQFINHIKERIKILGYELVIPNDDHKDFLNISNLTYYFSSSSINFYSLYKKEEEARKGILDILDIIKNTVKDIFSINLFNAILLNDHKYVSILLSKDHTYSRLGDFSFYEEENNFYVKGTINLDIISSLIEYHSHESSININDEIALTQVAIIPHKMNEQGISQTCKEIESLLQKEGYRVSYFSSTEPVKEKIDLSNLYGIPLRIELSPKDLAKETVKVYLKYDNSCQEVPISSLSKKIKIIFSRLKKMLVNDSIGYNYECDQGKISNFQIHYLCSTCSINTIEKEREYFLPFNQNFMEEHCQICNNIATKRVISLLKK
ncbi:MAG: His/Gly/Thr/Pro-type tRNA ligase C-terminal domain-containing protein [Bacilli bacterium]